MSEAERIELVATDRLDDVDDVADTKQGVQIAKMGAQTLLTQAERLNASLAKAQG